MAQVAPPPQVRISKIADRYLVFDADHVSILRRVHGISSCLVGSTPQNPTQNVFLSLPLELLPEEAAVLVAKNAAVLVDEGAFHLDALRSRDPAARKAYIAFLKESKEQARRHIAESIAQKKAHSKALEAKARTKKAKKKQAQAAADSSDALPLFTPDQAPEGQGSQTPKPADEVAAIPLAITPNTSRGLTPTGGEASHLAVPPPIGPLQRHLLANGYFITPGMRFGAKYSVYPGDSLRYHAHFLATDYEWDEEIPMLDIVGSGRLGTSVKKSFLMGGAPADHKGEGDGVRAFCIEWAAM